MSERDELERCIRHCLKLFDHDISITLNEVLKIACKRKLDCIIFQLSAKKKTFS